MSHGGVTSTYDDNDALLLLGQHPPNSPYDVADVIGGVMDQQQQQQHDPMVGPFSPATDPNW